MLQAISQLPLYAQALLGSVLVMLLSAYAHYLYLVRGWRGFSIAFTFALFIILFVYLFIPLYSIVYRSEPLLAVFAVLFTILFLALRSRFGFHCLSEEQESSGGVSYTVCHPDRLDAWYSFNAWEKRGRIYVSSALRDSLERSELEAVLLHEMGHKKSRVISLLQRTSIALWALGLLVIFTLSSYLLLLIAAVHALEPQLSYLAVQWLYLAATLNLLAPSFTSLAVLASWIAEHEADAKALEQVEAPVVASALVKVFAVASVRNALRRYTEYLREVKVEAAFPATHEIAAPRLKDVLKAFIVDAVLKAPNNLFEFMLDPAFRDHPPLEFRLYKVLSTIRGPRSEKTPG